VITLFPRLQLLSEGPCGIMPFYRQVHNHIEWVQRRGGTGIGEQRTIVAIGFEKVAPNLTYGDRVFTFNFMIDDRDLGGRLGASLQTKQCESGCENDCPRGFRIMIDMAYLPKMIGVSKGAKILPFHSCRSMNSMVAHSAL
jgi:hypothetical protein